MKHYFFMGIAGAGMSALAQYMAGRNYKISGSDRQFTANQNNETRNMLEKCGIKCFPQDGSGLNTHIDTMVVSTAIELNVAEYQKAKKMGIPIIMRSDLLAAIANTQQTIAIAGTSGKSTVAAMLYEIFEYAKISPSLIAGAGLKRLQRKNLIGNSIAGKSNLLIIEADESDGSLIKYKPETGVILNIEKDHKPLDELHEIFEKFSENTRSELIVNCKNKGSKKLSKSSKFDFMTDLLQPQKLHQTKNGISFILNGVHFKLKQIGAHNAENATAAAAIALCYDIPLTVSARALSQYEGIHRRHNIIGKAQGATIIDDYAHNPAKLAASLEACQAISSHVVLWFQPHGFRPLKFLKDDFVRELLRTMRPQDKVYFSDVFFAGGTTNKNISSEDVIKDLQELGLQAFYVPKRDDLFTLLDKKIKPDSIILLCGARDPSLTSFANNLFHELSENN